MSDMIPAWVDGVLCPVEKLSAHQRGLKHPAVSVFITAGEQVLIQKRAKEKYHTPGLWANTCCTHPIWNEDPKDCAVRRLEQELGISGVDPQLRQQIEYKADVGNGLLEHEVVDVFVATSRPDLAIKPNPDEVADYAWVKLDDLVEDAVQYPAKYTPWLRIYLDQHLGEIFGR